MSIASLLPTNLIVDYIKCAGPLAPPCRPPTATPPPPLSTPCVSAPSSGRRYAMQLEDFNLVYYLGLGLVLVCIFASIPLLVALSKRHGKKEASACLLRPATLLVVAGSALHPAFSTPPSPTPAVAGARGHVCGRGRPLHRCFPRATPRDAPWPLLPPLCLRGRWHVCFVRPARCAARRHHRL